MASSFVVVHDLHARCGDIAPLEANPPLIVDTDAVLSMPVTVQRFQTIARRNTQIVELFGGVNNEKLAPRSTLNLIRYSLDDVARKHRCRVLVSEAFDHGDKAYR
jgi:hypothetical protein